MEVSVGSNFDVGSNIDVGWSIDVGTQVHLGTGKWAGTLHLHYKNQNYCNSNDHLNLADTFSYLPSISASVSCIDYWPLSCTIWPQADFPCFRRSSDDCSISVVFTQVASRNWPRDLQIAFYSIQNIGFCGLSKNALSSFLICSVACKYLGTLSVLCCF